MTKKEGRHDMGIRERIEKIWEEDKHNILAVLPNVHYHAWGHRPPLHGELDILKIYTCGRIGIEEVKSSYKHRDKAIQQLQRAARAFFRYNPSIKLYTVESGRLFDVDYNGKRR